MPDNKKSARLTERTNEIINKHGRIILKADDGWYIHCWTNIAAGPDAAQWGKAKAALEFFNLEWAFTIAPLYKCTVVVRYPKKKN